MKRFLVLAVIVLFTVQSQSQTFIKEKGTDLPVSFATISFGNGNGIFADDEGKFIFTKKLYSDIDSLFISSIGYKELRVATENLPSTLFLEPSQEELDEVIVNSKPKGKFKIEELEPNLHEDYFKCWLPSIESEIAVFFPRHKNKQNKVEKVLLPIKVEAADWDKRKRKNVVKRPFSTLFKVNFYENIDGLPGDALTYDKIVFRVTEKSEPVFKLDVSENDIYIPKNGMFVSIQVLGYTDKLGKLLPNKKYREIKTKKGIVKVSTTFRPLLPFTDKVKSQKTYVKRVFLNGNKWVSFEKQNIQTLSKLLKEGLNNYGMGLELKVYQED
ncbi:hypothetical protein [Pseudofulvibacter geojedonensis]|uniref:Carboxypeptidase-like regulatory domain-containing protein n=1 Tax=Pseudofulvibacter geojedonensis TaxID=1123758 RepID=A0ABW3I2E3_9FLAO